MYHYDLFDLHAKEPHFVRIAYPSLAQVRQEQLVKGVLYSLGVVNKIFVNGFLFVLFSVQNGSQFATRILLGFPLQRVLKHFVLRICRLLDDFLQCYRDIRLGIHVILYDHFSHLNVIHYPE